MYMTFLSLHLPISLSVVFLLNILSIDARPYFICGGLQRLVILKPFFSVLNILNGVYISFVILLTET